MPLDPPLKDGLLMTRSSSVGDVVVSVIIIIIIIIIIIVVILCDHPRLLLLLLQLLAGAAKSVLFLPDEHRVQDVMRRRTGRLQFGQHLHQLASETHVSYRSTVARRRARLALGSVTADSSGHAAYTATVRTVNSPTRQLA